MKRLLIFLLCSVIALSSLSVAAGAADLELKESSAESDITEEAANIKIADESANADAAQVGANADDTASTGYTLLTEAQFQSKLSALRSKYPHGSIWEGVYYEGGYARAWTCWAYAAQMLYEVFGVRFYGDGMLDNKSYNVYGICAGDWVRIDGDSHSIFITKVTDNGVYFTDGNGTGVYNQVRWDGFYSWSEIARRFSYRLYVPGNDLTGNAVMHTIAYNANGGSGSVSSQSVAPGGGFTVKDSSFYRAGYRFKGYTVNRSSDNKWFCVGGKGWQYADDVEYYGYNYAIYDPGEEHSINTAWLGSTTSPTTFTFYAQWEPIHTVEYDANGGYGNISSEMLGANERFTIKDNNFSRDGYDFAGYSVRRSSDNKWFTGSDGWQSQSDVYRNGYSLSYYYPGESYRMSTNWLEDLDEETTLTFYAQWLPHKAKLEFMANYSGYNHMLGSDLRGNYSNYIFSRDQDVYTVTRDSSERLNNADSLKIVGKYAGESGSDLALKTSTNYGYGDGYSTAAPAGDSKIFYLHFYAKADVDNAKMYFRWGYSSDFTSISLTREWQTYYVALPKSPYYSPTIHPYFDKAGTYYINSLALSDIAWTSNVVPETGFKAAPDQTFTRGEAPGTLPTPTRSGYTFTGWYTEPEGGNRITANTKIAYSALRLYAHWRKDSSKTPVKTVKANGHIYALYDNKLGWEDAADFCEEQGGHLVSINSAEENQLVYDMISDRQGYCWIGLTYIDYTSSWVWVDGTDYADYHNWYDPYYGTTDSGEHYAMIYPMDYGNNPYAGTWDKCTGSDYYCSYYGYYNSFYICEIDDPVILGDTDGNSEVETIDATLIQRYHAGLELGLFDSEMRADVNGDGVIDIIDATFILRYLTGIDTPYDVGEWVNKANNYM